MKTKIKILFAALLLNFFIGGIALAADVKKPTEVIKKGTGPAISPAVLNLDASLGEKKDLSFDYFNNKDETVTILIDIRPFVPSNGETGSPVYQDDKGQRITSPISSWIKLSKTEYIVLKKEKQKIDFTVTIPKDAESKKYYAAIFAQEKVKDNPSSGSTFAAEIGALLVANVHAPLSDKTRQVEIGQGSYFYYYLLAIFLIIIAFLVILLRKDKGVSKKKKIISKK